MNYISISKISNKVAGIAIIAGLFLVPNGAFGASAAIPAVNPTVSTLPPQSITETTATLNGSYSLNGASSAIVWFQYGTTSGSLSTSTAPVIKTQTTGTFSANISGLNAGTTYFYKAYASYNGVTTPATTTLAFTTNGGQTAKNQVTTLPPSSITTTSANLNAFVNVKNTGTYTLIYKWAKSNELSTSTLVYGVVSGQTGQKTQNLSGLNPDTTYNYKACLRDANGVDQCATTQVTFTTAKSVTPPPSIYECNDGTDNDGDGHTDYPSDAGCTSSTDDSENSDGTPCTSDCGGNDGPDATTLSATDIEEDGATLRGEIDPNGDEIDEVWFEYGEDEDDLDESETVDEDDYDNDDNDSFDVELSIDNLDNDTEYFFRVCAENSDGEDCGSVRSFSTDDDGGNNDDNNDDDDNDYVHDSPQVIPRIIYKTTTIGSTSSKIMLSIDTRFDNAYSGDTIDYIVKYKNTSGSTLSNAILHIEFPKEVTFRRANEGHYNQKDHTLTLDLGTLSRGESDEITVSVRAESSIRARTELVTKATLAFTMPNSAQENAIAYAITKVSDTTIRGNSLAGTALFGGDGFLPNSLIEWLILIVLMAFIIAGFRYYKHAEMKAV